MHDLTTDLGLSITPPTCHIIIAHNHPITAVAITTTSIMYHRVTRNPARRPIARLQLLPRTKNLRDPMRQNRKKTEDASLDLQKMGRE